MGRIYYVHTGEVTSAAATPVDLEEITCGADKTLLLHGVEISQSNITTDEMIRYQILRYSGAFTSGSGGAAATVTKQAAGDSAHSMTVERNNTTICTGGTEEILAHGSFYVMAGLNWSPRGRPPELQATDAFVVRLVDGPVGSTDFMTIATVEEIG